MKQFKNSPEAFIELIKQFSHESSNYLYNFTFFLGAGFSKSWDAEFPLGNELFQLKQKDLSDALYLKDLLWFLNLEYSSTNKDSKSPKKKKCAITSLKDRLKEIFSTNKNEIIIDYNIFKEIVYRLNMYLKYPSIRPRYLDDGNIPLIINELKYLVFKKFRQVATLYYLNEKKNKLTTSKKTGNQEKIINFFNLLYKCGKGDTGVPRGIRFHFLTTNYDFIPEFIFEQIFGQMWPYPLHVYRGISPKLFNGKPNIFAIHDHFWVYNLLKINGGFEIFFENNCFHIDYRQKTDDQIKMNPPVIMLPSKEQDYSDLYFTNIFTKSVRLLQESCVLIIVGYSLPKEDSLLRFLLQHFAEDIADLNQKIIFYIDKISEDQQKEKITKLFPFLRKYTENFYSFSGSFVEWVEAILKYF